MPYKKATAKRAKSMLSDDIREFMLTGVQAEYPEDSFVYFEIVTDAEALQKVWEESRDVLMKEWLENNAGRRPWCWWQYDSREPRKRVGGKGTAINDCSLGYMQPYSFGLPTAFVSEWQVAYYNGQAVDIHGKQILSKYKEGSFEAEPYDESDPPTYESEAAYLQRLGLLIESEKKALATKRSVFEPVTVER